MRLRRWTWPRMVSRHHCLPTRRWILKFQLTNSIDSTYVYVYIYVVCIYLADIRSGVYSSGFHNPVNAGYFLVDVDNRLFSAQHSPLYRHGGFIDKTSIKMDEGARSIYFFCCTWYFQVTVGKGRPLARQTRSKSVPSCSWCCDGPFSCWSMVAGTALGRTAHQPNPHRTGTDTCPTTKKEREKKEKQVTIIS